MKWLKSVSIILLITLFSGSASAVTVFSGEENSLLLYKQLSEELLKEPSGLNSEVFVKKLIALSGVAGRTQTAGLFMEALKKIDKGDGGVKPSYMFMKFALEDMGIPADFRKPGFRNIDRWIISGPWQRYGAPDIDYRFPPELNLKKIADSPRKISTPDFKIYPFGFVPERRGIVYAATSFESASPVKLWIVANAEYKLFINGKEVLYCEKDYNNSVAGVTVKGSKGYTVIFKIADNSAGADPYFKLIITDLSGKYISPDYSDSFYTGSFTAEKDVVSSDVRFSPGFDGAIKAAELRRFIKSGELEKAVTTGTGIITRYPYYFDAYDELIPLLIKMNRDKEFSEYISLFRKNFPDSDYHLKWESEYYSKADKAKAAEIMGGINSSLISNAAAEFYMRYLLETGDKAGALKFSEKFRDVPSLRGVVSETIKRCSGNDSWRRYLVSMIASTDDPLFYYQIGLADMDSGLDPLLYWEKGLSLRNDMRDMRDMADIFENGMDKGKVFYSGKFTGLKPEFKWNGLKRKVTVRIFENGNYMTECEDIIPGTQRGGELKLLPLNNMRILYVLKSSKDTIGNSEFEPIKENNGALSVRLKDQGECDFIVVKYSGYSSFEKYPFRIVKDLALKNESEDVSELELEVLSYRSTKPGVNFMNRKIKGEEGELQDVLRYHAVEKFSQASGERTLLTVDCFQSDTDFAAWYGGLFRLRKEFAVLQPMPELKGETPAKTAENVKKYTNEKFSNDGGMNFAPSKAEKIFSEKRGSSEELTLISAVILENIDVMAFPAFIKQGKEFTDGDNLILLYIPESKGKGHWLNFNSVTDKIDSSEALVIKRDSFETIPFVKEGGE